MLSFTDVILSSAYNNKDNHSIVTNLLLVHMGFIKVSYYECVCIKGLVCRECEWTKTL